MPDIGLTVETPFEDSFATVRSFMFEGSIDDYLWLILDTDQEDGMIQVEKEGEESQLTTPVENEEFSTEVPLNLGEGIHTINVMVYIEAEDLYYDAAYMLANASSDF